MRIEAEGFEVEGLSVTVEGWETLEINFAEDRSLTVRISHEEISFSRTQSALGGPRVYASANIHELLDQINQAEEA